jgi:hypothetical protein
LRYARLLSILVLLSMLITMGTGCSGPAAQVVTTSSSTQTTTTTLTTESTAVISSTSSETTTQNSTSTTTTTTVPTTTTTQTSTTPVILQIPEETLNSHFGFGYDTSWAHSADSQQELADLGKKWEQGLPGPFSWYIVEKEKGKYDWSKVDQYIQQVQQYGFAIVPTIWPFTDWDQASWAPLPTGPQGSILQELGKGRRKPHDINAYMSFVSVMVERYDGDGTNDMPGLKYPIKYWEPCDEPHVKPYFDGTPQDYLEVLIASYEAIKKADPEAKVLFAAVDVEGSFIKPILEQGAEYFDIANVHSLSNNVNFWVPELRNLLSSYGINKPIWVTTAEFQIGRYLFDNNISLESQGQLLAKGSVTAFAYGADKIFYNWFRAPQTGDPRWKAEVTARFQSAALIDENGVKRPAYYALVTMLRKIEGFTSAEKLAEGRFLFKIGYKNIYAMWGPGVLPEEVVGELIVTDIYGNETRTNSSAINLTQNFVFVEIATGTP